MTPLKLNLLVNFIIISNGKAIKSYDEIDSSIISIL